MHPTGDAQPWYYLKDWHFVAEFPAAHVYETPVYFQDDWLNEFYDIQQHQAQQQAHSREQQQQGATSPEQQGAPSQQLLQQNIELGEIISINGSSPGTSSNSSNVMTSDYRFVYLGPAGSWTPLHSDVLRSYSWSANVVGRKRWWLLPPEHTHLLKDQHGQLPTDLLAPEAAAVWEHIIEVMQEAGDVLFVPSGWHHMVVNEVDTLSINHNWINGHNIHWSWALLQYEHEQVSQLLEDCRYGLLSWGDNVWQRCKQAVDVTRTVHHAVPTTT
eukprot:GHRR01024262.1.p1 GENE.GHRR01024262.1~~GHRR01024262.1.p1  ORF type:complete len:272 (+),score=112.44 GHRR01024262.1:1844-2659(+)